MARVTLKDVAARAGVNPATVSRALDPDKRRLVNPATRDRVFEAAEELGYRRNAVAWGLRKGRSGTIGIVVADLGNPFIAPVLRGIENALDGRDLLPLITESQDRSDRLMRSLEHLVSRRVDVIITSAVHLGDKSGLARVTSGVPVVLAVRTFLDRSYPAVTHDDVEGGHLAARHLVGLGHRHILELPGPDDVSSFVARQEGFRKGLAGERVELLPGVPSAAKPTMEEGYRLMAQALAAGARPTGVFAHNDLMAIGALDAAAAAGLDCPDDISMIGYNDSQLVDHLTPSLTTVRLPSYQLGRVAADLAVAALDHPDVEPTTVTIPPLVIMRKSTAVAPPR